MSPLEKLIALERQATLMGIDWPNTETIIDQALSECDEIKRTIQLKEGRERLQEEVGDLVHAVVSLCLFEGFDFEQIISQVNKKFGARLEALQKIAAHRGLTTLKGHPFGFLLELWEEAKKIADNAN